MDHWLRARAKAELPGAERALADGKARLDSVAARLLEYRRKGLRVRDSERLLVLLTQSHELQTRHVETLKREIRTGASPLPPPTERERESRAASWYDVLRRQRDLIAELERLGADTTLAEQLLANFEASQRALLAKRDQLTSEQWGWNRRLGA